MAKSKKQAQEVTSHISENALISQLRALGINASAYTIRGLLKEVKAEPAITIPFGPNRVSRLYTLEEAQRIAEELVAKAKPKPAPQAAAAAPNAAADQVMKLLVRLNEQQVMMRDSQTHIQNLHEEGLNELRAELKELRETVSKLVELWTPIKDDPRESDTKHN